MTSPLKQVANLPGLRVTDPKEKWWKFVENKLSLYNRSLIFTLKKIIMKILFDALTKQGKIFFATHFPVLGM